MATSARLDELKKKFDENPRRYFAPLANEYRKLGDLTQAIALCRAHLPNQPGHISGHIVLAQALYEARELGESRQYFEAALDLDPENLIALRYLGDIAREQGEPGQARVWYERVLEADPRNDEIALLLQELAPDTASTAVEEEDARFAPPVASSVESFVEMELAGEGLTGEAVSASDESPFAFSDSVVSTTVDDPYPEPVEILHDLPATTATLTFFESTTSEEHPESGEQSPLTDPFFGAAQGADTISHGELEAVAAPSSADDWFDSAIVLPPVAPPSVATSPGSDFDDAFFPDLAEVTPIASAAVVEETATAEVTERPSEATVPTPSYIRSESQSTIPTPAFLASIELDDVAPASPEPVSQRADLKFDPTDHAPAAHLESHEASTSEAEGESSVVESGLETVASGLDISDFSWAPAVPAPDEATTFDRLDDDSREAPSVTASSEEVEEPTLEVEVIAETSFEELQLAVPTLESEPEQKASLVEDIFADSSSVARAFDAAPLSVESSDDASPASSSDASSAVEESQRPAWPFAATPVAESVVAVEVPSEPYFAPEANAQANEPVAAIEGLDRGSFDTLDSFDSSDVSDSAAVADIDVEFGEFVAPRDDATPFIASSISVPLDEPDAYAVGTPDLSAHTPFPIEAGFADESLSNSSARPTPRDVDSVAPVEGLVSREVQGIDQPELAFDQASIMTTPEPSGFVTETMAELYLQQGFRDEGLSIYRQLLALQPNDETIRNRVAALERGESSTVLAGVAARDPFDRAGQSVRHFFAHFARRQPRARGGEQSTDFEHSISAEVAGVVAHEDEGRFAGAANRDEALTVPDDAAAAPSLAQLFATGEVSGADERAASALASAYESNEVPAASRTAEKELSLEHLFRDVPSRSSGAVTLDEYYEGSSHEGSDPTPRESEDGGERGADIEQFTAWLEGLKKK